MKIWNWLQIPLVVKKRHPPVDVVEFQRTLTMMYPSVRQGQTHSSHRAPGDIGGHHRAWPFGSSERKKGCEGLRRFRSFWGHWKFGNFEKSIFLFEVWTVGHERHLSLLNFLKRQLVGTGHHLLLGMCHLYTGQVLRKKGDGLRGSYKSYK